MIFGLHSKRLDYIVGHCFTGYWHSRTDCHRRNL